VIVRIVLSVVGHLIGNEIIVCYVIFTSKCEVSFLVTFNAMKERHIMVRTESQFVKEIIIR